MAAVDESLRSEEKKPNTSDTILESAMRDLNVSKVEGSDVTASSGMTQISNTIKLDDRLNMDKYIYKSMYESFKRKDFGTIQSLVQNQNADINHLFTETFVDVSDRGWSILHFLSQKGDYKRMKFVVELGANAAIKTRKGDTALHLACKHGHYQCVEFLKQCGTKVIDQQNIQGLTPLMKAIYRFDTAFKENDYKKTINLLISAGCDVNISPESKITPLHVVAGKWKSVNMVEKLIQAGADVNADSGSSSPLLAAVCRQRIDSATVIALINAGANVNYKNPNGKSVLHITVSKSEDICVEHLLKAGADANIKDQDGNSPLWIAVCENNIKIAPLLLAHGANVNFCNNQYGLSLLAKATMNRNVKMVKLLLENDADVNITTVLGASALHYAVDNSDITVTKLLLSKNCDMENYSSFRNLYTPQNVLQIAMDLGNGDLIKLLLLAGFPLTEYAIKLNNLPDIVKEDSELVEWIYDYFYSPKPLQHLCCISLRKHLGSQLSQVVDELYKSHDIPQSLSDLILLKHFLDEKKNSSPDLTIEWH